MNNPEIEKVLRDCADKFHKILSSYAAGEIIRTSKSMHAYRLEELKKKVLLGSEIDKLCIAGFQECVEALVKMGAKDVSVHECNPSEGQLCQEEPDE